MNTQDLPERDTESGAKFLDWRGGLSDEVLERSASILSEIVVNTAEQSKDHLLTRWDQNERLFRNEESADEQGPLRHIPIIKPKASFLLGSIVSGIVSATPPFAAFFLENGNRRRDNKREELVSYLLRKANWRRALSQNSVQAYNCAQSFLRAYVALPEQAPDSPTKRKNEYGIIIEAIHPRSMFAFPDTVQDIDDLILIGHYSLELRETLQLAANLGIFNPDVINELPVATTKSPIPNKGEQPEIRKWGEPGSTTDPTSDQPRDQGKDRKPYDLIRIAQGIWRTDLDGDGKRELYVCTFHAESKKLLRIEPYNYDTIWYIKTYFEVDSFESGFWGQSALIQDVKGVQLAMNELWHSFEEAARNIASPPVLSKTGLFGSFGKTLRYKSGHVNPVDAEDVPTAVNIGGDVGPVATGIEFLDGVADRASRVSKSATGEALPPSGTATEAVLLQQNQNVTLSSAHLEYGQTLVRLAELLEEYALKHYDDLRAVYGNELPAIGEAGDKMCEWELYGTQPAKNPGAVFAAAQLLAGIAEDPEFGLNKWEIGRLLVEAAPIENKDVVQVPREVVKEALIKAQMEQDQMEEMGQQAAAIDAQTSLEASQAPAPAAPQGAEALPGPPAPDAGTVRPSPDELLANLDAEFPD